MRGRANWRDLILGTAIVTVLPLEAALAAQVSSGPATAPPGRCNITAIQSMAPSETTITAASPTATPVPHCKIDGYVTTTNPGPNKVMFRLQLPDKGWTGRYYFIGLGAAAGYVPTDSQIPPGNPLNAGFAVAGTDTGHEGPMIDWSFMGRNRAQAVDHIHRGAHVTAVATEQITKAYYRTDKMYRYMSGCSGGGRMSVMAITRHPEDFDGVLLGAPGGRSSATMIKFIAAAQEQMREPGAWVSPRKLAFLESKVTAACDATDGAIDNIVADHRKCHFDVGTLACHADMPADASDCLTQPEIRTIKAVERGPLGPDGKPITQGMPLTNASSWSGFIGTTPPPWSNDPADFIHGKGNAGLVIANTMAQSLFGPNYNALTQFHSTSKADIDAWWAAAHKLDYGEPYSADMRDFQRRGGKVLFWNGTSDPCCSDIEMEQYYHDIGKMALGGEASMPSWARYYRVPGMAHCGGGTGPGDAPDQMLKALIDFVEKGKKTEEIVAHRGNDRVRMLFADPTTKVVSGVIVPPPVGVSRDFLLCPYPKVATFNGASAAGSVLSASNWSCRMPTQTAEATAPR